MKFKEKLKWPFQKPTRVDKNRNISKHVSDKDSWKLPAAEKGTASRLGMVDWTLKPRPHRREQTRHLFKKSGKDRKMSVEDGHRNNRLNVGDVKSGITDKPDYFVNSVKYGAEVWGQEKADMCVMMPSRLNSVQEKVDFSMLVKPVPFKQNTKKKAMKFQKDNNNEFVETLDFEIANDLKLQGRNSEDTNVTRVNVSGLLNKDGSPTCSDIYGNDEMDNETSGFCSGLVSSWENKDVRNNKNDNKEVKCSFNPEKTLEGLEPDKKESHSVDTYGNPWMLQRDFVENVGGVHGNRNMQELHGSVELTNKPINWLKTEHIEMETSFQSFGFEVNSQTVFEEEDIKCKLPRSESSESVDSFSSSIHSAHTNDLFFSDSEAEHDKDQFETLKNTNDFEEASDDPDDIEKPKKQIIPLALSEKFSKGNSFAKGQGKKLTRKSVEDKINELAKDVSRFIDGKEVAGNFGKSKNLHNKLSRSFDDSFTECDAEKEMKKKHRGQNRRSLDSTVDIKDYTYQVDSLGKRKSMLASSTELLLTPVLEAESKVNEKISNHKDVGTDDSKKFYTLPNPRKRKSSQSLRRKSSRLGSISKMFSEKAHSLTNLKFGSSFKLRSEKSGSDKSWAPLSLSANSLANMMVKKASNIGTLIRGRSNSNPITESPFKQYTKKKSRVKDENETELVYEKVLVSVPRKRPISTNEQKSVKKQLKVNLELAKNAGKKDLEAQISEELDIGSDRNSSLLPYGKAGLHSPLHSPTLLDEIMKSVDAETVHQLCSNTDKNSDDSSDCDSSSGSSLFLFQKRYSLESELSDRRSNRGSVMMAYCRVCGRIKSVSDGSTDSSDGDVAALSRQAISLCDLTTMCQCVKRRNKVRKNNKKRLSDGDRKSWLVVGEKENLIGPFESTRFSSCSNTCAKSFSVNDLRGSEKSLFYEKLETASEQRNEAVISLDFANEIKPDFKMLDSIPGCLLRHEPVLDLSADSLDKVEGSKSSFRSLNEHIGSEVNICSEGVSFLSCSEMVGNNLQMENGDRPCHKSHSCGDLLDSENIIVCDKLCKKEKGKKEIRKVKVKSLSSSHDVLNQVVSVDNVEINVDDIECKACVGNDGDSKQEISNVCIRNNRESQEEINKGKEAEAKTEISVNGICVENHMNVKIICESEVEKENQSGMSEMESKKLALKSNKFDRKRKTGNVIFDKNMKVTSKPPLPFQKIHAHCMSLSDLNHCDSRENVSKECKMRLRYSTGDSVPVEIDFTKSEQCEHSSRESKPETSRFLFDEKSIKVLWKQGHLSRSRRKSLSSNDISNVDTLTKSWKEKLLTVHSINQLSQDFFVDDVFQPNSVPSENLEIPLPLSDPFKYYNDFGRVSFPDIEGEGFSPFGDESVYKYDVCLGYLLHSVQCDNTTICVYSLQRNKQFMESMVTPLAALPGSPTHTKTGQQNSPNKPKTASKTRLEEIPNPAAPITQVPSVRLVHAGHVLRTVLLARAPHMIRDRKFHLRTYRRCMVGTEMVDWLLQQSALVHCRTQAVGMWQALVEEGVVVHVCHEHQFKDKYLFYRFHEDDEGVSTVPSTATKRECEDDLPDVFLLLAQIGPDAMMRMILRKPSHERTSEDLEIIYEELLHIKALSHLSTMVKRELASVLVFESHAKAGTVLFNQGDEGKSWYIILKGSVNVVIYGKGVVCTLHEGDDFGKLALVNDAPRAATIVLRDDNCHFLRVDKDDFNRILRDVEANTVRLKEHSQDVLVLEKIPSNTQTADGTVQAHYKYSVMAGTPEKMLEHLLESRLDNRNETEIDGFLEDFLLTHVIFMPYNHLCPVLLSHYHSSTADSTEQEGLEFMLNHKKCVLHFVQEWANIVGAPFKQDHTINAFLEELLSCVQDDLQDYPTLKDDLASLESILTAHSGSLSNRQKKRSSGSFLLSKKASKENLMDQPKKRKPIKPSDESVFKVYCADHTYTTLKLPMDARVEQLLALTTEKLGLGDDLLLCEVKSTGERLIFKENDLCVTTGLSINGKLFVTPKEHLDALTALPEQEGPSDGSFPTIEVFSSREMAYHMTLYDWELFSCVQEYELIYQVFGRHKFGKITANLDMFLRRFNEIQYWVVTEMVLATNLSKRVSLLRKFIKIAAHCKEFRNLNSFFAIVMGLSNIAVSRLSQTWEKLPGKFKKMFADFETLMDPSRNHRVYRLSVAKMLPPIIPFMPLLMKDMTFTHEGNKTYFDGLVNFEKMHMIAQTLKTIQFCRSAPLDLEVPGTLKSMETAEYIRDLHVIDNQRRLTQLSHKLEPRKT